MTTGSRRKHISLEEKSPDYESKVKSRFKEECLVTGIEPFQRLKGGSEAGPSEYSIPEEERGDPFDQIMPKNYRYLSKPLRYTKNVVMLVCWLIFTFFLMANKETELQNVILSVPAGREGLTYSINKRRPDSNLCLILYGSFIKSAFKFDELPLTDLVSPNLIVELQLVDDDGSVKRTKSILQLHLAEQQEQGEPKIEMVEKIIDYIHFNDSKYQLHFFSNIKDAIPLELSYEFTIMSKKSGLILGLILLLLIYVALIFEMVHRTVAGIICSTLAIGIIAAVHLRPSQQVIFNEWANIDTVMLFFGFSIIIELLLETGLQDYLAAFSYKFSNGHIWPMLHCVLLLSFLLSNIFDAVLLVLFIAPICLRLCEIMELNSTPILSALIIFINVGSSLSPINSITNNLIINSPFLPMDHQNFSEFVIHMLPATLLALAQSYIHLRLQFHNSDKMRTFEPFQVRRIKHLIDVWHRASMGMGDYTWDDTLARQTVDRRIVNLRKRLKRFGKMPTKPVGFDTKVKNLKQHFSIRKPYLLTVCIISIFISLLFSIMAIFINCFQVSKGWIAILAALFVLSLTCYEDFEGMFTRIDWCTMLFFVTLSIIMQVLITLGLLEYIGLMLEHFIVSVDEHNRLTVAILVIIWISAILTTFIDNVPVANMMMSIIGTMSLKENNNMPIMPLMWSLALGCTLGGNGSIMAAVANIACAGVASRHGYNIRFLSFLKIGFFVMVGNITMASCYLLYAHVGFHWH